MSNEDNIIDEAKKNAEEASEEIGEAIDEASDTVADAVSEVVNRVEEAGDEAGETVADKISEAVNETDEAASDKITDMASEASQAVEDAGEAVEGASQTAADKVAEAITEAAPAETKPTELDELVAELKVAAPPDAIDSDYSPIGLAALLQDYFPRLPADLQSRILEIFRDMDVKDLVSIETWKGIVTMIGYSAKTQVEQVADVVDTVLPEPLKTRNLLGLFQSSADKFTPSVLKDAVSGVKGMASDLEGIASNIEGMSAEDLINPETWKGLYYLLDYGLRAQVTLIKERVMGGGDDDFDDFDDDWDDDWDE